MYQYRVIGTFQDGSQRVKFDELINADSGEQAIEYAKILYFQAEVTEVHYVGKANLPKGRGRVQ